LFISYSDLSPSPLVVTAEVNAGLSLDDLILLNRDLRDVAVEEAVSVVISYLLLFLYRDIPVGEAVAVVVVNNYCLYQMSR
jgi:hypothetical protein